MYTNEDLQIFVDLSQTLSFSQTARNLHLSQSTVSKRIKDLETALQVVLIERGQGMKSLRLTLAGENFLTIANEMLSLWKDACHLGRGRWQSSFTIASLSSLNIQAIPTISDYLQIILAVLIFALLGYVVFRSTRKEKAVEPEPELSVESLLESTKESADTLQDIGFNEKSETRVLIEKFVEENPEAAASLLRNWLNEEWE